ncbi:hypothetical protein B0H14DRAFT_3515781 [Mycena olivaceomarginata]|nr:hypothetical protein B0H14DRAFT_3515781 [Mycena olivaceomarginata]
MPLFTDHNTMKIDMWRVCCPEPECLCFLPAPRQCQHDQNRGKWYTACYHESHGHRFKFWVLGTTAALPATQVNAPPPTQNNICPAAQPYVSSITKSFVNHVQTSLARQPYNLDNLGAYQATALSVRDNLFLMGSTLDNALLNLGLKDKYAEHMKSLGFSMEDILDQERDTALGNGGLAACYFNSSASQELPVWGYGLRYKYGIFQQLISPADDSLRCAPDSWLDNQNPWELPRLAVAYEVRFYGDADRLNEGTPRAGVGGCPSDGMIPATSPRTGFDPSGSMGLPMWEASGLVLVLGVQLLRTPLVGGPQCSSPVCASRRRQHELPQCLARQQEAAARLAPLTSLPPLPTLLQEARDKALAIKRTERVLRLDPRHRATPALAPLLHKPVETSLKSSGEGCVSLHAGNIWPYSCCRVHAPARAGAGRGRLMWGEWGRVGAGAGASSCTISERWHGVAQVRMDAGQVQIRHGCWACAETASGERRCVEDVGGDVGEMWRCDAYAQARRREERLLSGEIDSLDAQGCVGMFCALRLGIAPARHGSRIGEPTRAVVGVGGARRSGWERLPGDVRDSAPGDIGLAPRERGCDALRCPIEGWDMIFGVGRRERKEARGGTCVRAPGLRVRVRSLNERDTTLDAVCLGDGSRDTGVYACDTLRDHAQSWFYSSARERAEIREYGEARRAGVDPRPDKAEAAEPSCGYDIGI